MTKPDGKIAGILGAIILHLIAAIIFMAVKIGTLNVDKRTREYQIALEDISIPLLERHLIFEFCRDDFGLLPDFASQDQEPAHASER